MQGTLENSGLQDPGQRREKSMADDILLRHPPPLSTSPGNPDQSGCVCALAPADGRTPWSARERNVPWICAGPDNRELGSSLFLQFLLWKLSLHLGVLAGVCVKVSSSRCIISGRLCRRRGGALTSYAGPRGTCPNEAGLFGDAARQPGRDERGARDDAPAGRWRHRASKGTHRPSCPPLAAEREKASV